MPRYIVQTQDVDGRSRKTYKSLAGALKRFEAMYGHPLQAALNEVYFDKDGNPTVTAESWLNASRTRTIRGVSNYGTVVALTLDFGTYPVD